MSCDAASGHALADDPRFQRLKAQLIATTGLAYYHNKDAVICERLGDRLAQLDLADDDTYWDRFDDHGESATEIDHLVEQLTIGETSFFRHREMFDALRDSVLPEVIERNQSTRRLRVWSAGCSFGPEPYSISILLRREFAQRLAGWDVRILGTDINRGFLARARAGYFDEWAFRGVGDDVKQACFTLTGKGRSINPEFQEGVKFEYHNLAEWSAWAGIRPVGGFDVILCRNVMIYFNGETMRQLARGFHDSLADSGWLLVGHAEPNVDIFRAFTTVNTPGAVLYRKSREPSDRSPSASGRNSFAPTERSIAPLPLVARRKPAASAATTEPCEPPHSPRSEFSELRSLTDQGELRQALRLCETLLEGEPLDVALHQYHALILSQLGHHHEAEQALRRAIYLDRDAALAHYYLGLLRQQRGSQREAARSFDNTLRALAHRRSDQAVREGDDLTAADLEGLARARLKDLTGKPRAADDQPRWR